MIKEGYIVEIGDRLWRYPLGNRIGNWQPIRREIIVELVGIGQESFIDDSASRSLGFDRVD